jgi:Predicted membrane protein
MSSPASFKGHPLHPILVALPIGLWIFSLVSDVILKMSWGGPAWNDVALYTIGGGTVGALIAALPGFIDFASLTNPKTKSIALWHMMINLLAVVLYAVNFWLRMHRATGDNLPILLSVAGIVLITISGWLGGELVYVRGVAVKQPPDQST